MPLTDRQFTELFPRIAQRVRANHEIARRRDGLRDRLLLPGRVRYNADFVYDWFVEHKPALDTREQREEVENAIKAAAAEADYRDAENGRYGAVPALFFILLVKIIIEIIMLWWQFSESKRCDAQ